MCQRERLHEAYQSCLSLVKRMPTDSRLSDLDKPGAHSSCEAGTTWGLTIRIWVWGYFVRKGKRVRSAVIEHHECCSFVVSYTTLVRVLERPCASVIDNPHLYSTKFSWLM